MSRRRTDYRRISKLLEHHRVGPHVAGFNYGPDPANWPAGKQVQYWINGQEITEDEIPPFATVVVLSWDHDDNDPDAIQLRWFDND